MREDELLGAHGATVELSLELFVIDACKGVLLVDDEDAVFDGGEDVSVVKLFGLDQYGRWCGVGRLVVGGYFGAHDFIHLLPIVASGGGWIALKGGRSSGGSGGGWCGRFLGV